MTAPEVNSAESFGLLPGEAGYETFETDFPTGDLTTPAPDDFQDKIVPTRDLNWPFTRPYDSVIGETWQLRAVGKDAEADALLGDYGLVPERPDNK